ncbi:MAG: phosphoribosylanthranilate isomerase [Rickettsiales bacterium]|jgi:phosphoribosylanthranilate isomerase|nr:phosphoribosylanthranilate isomerase [Rickettsiales bacterium]
MSYNPAHNVQVKVCGLTTKEAVAQAVASGANYIGMVFFPASPRNVSPKQAAELLANIPASIQKVAVVVEPTDEELDALFAEFKPDYLQLHGKEPVARTSEIKERYKIKIMKACPVRSGDDIAAMGVYASVADMFLFDAKAPETSALPGGNGLSFDWHLLKGRHFEKPWLLSGGLGIDNVEEAVRITEAMGVDASSSIERAPGEKDPALVKAFIEKVKSL